MKVEHFALNVKQPKEMAEWWAQHLGLSIIRADTEAPFIHFLADDDNETLIELYANDMGEYPDYAELSKFTFHIAFAVDDIAGEIERLLAVGASPLGDVVTMGNGDRLGFVRDPWGMPIQFCQRDKPLV